MLPDFPKQKNKLLRLLTNRFVQKQREFLGYFDTIPSFAHHEGEQWIIEREDGTRSEETYHSIEAGFSLQHSEIPNLTLKEVIERIDNAAEEMAKQQVQDIFGALERATRESGRNIDAKGSPLTKELFLRLLGSIEFGFDKNGKANFPDLILHPSMWEKYKDEMRTWEEDPDFKSRIEKLVEQKREVWRDRESRRKLVD